MSISPTISPPPLESGDRLTRVEFERRYQLMPDNKKAELIEGVVYVASPVRANRHGKPHAKIITWLGTYGVATPGVDVQDNTTVCLDADNEPQPDALLRIEPEVGGNSRITEDDYIEGAPELIVEIAASSASYDLNDKLNAYRRNGVQEYIVWQSYENRIDWFRLEEGRYVSVEPDEAGIIRSRIFPGLWLAVNALREGNLAEVLAVLQQGVQTAEHQAFVQRLNPQG
ncbi:MULTISPECIES: Uma2 family endonuclease [unclassified Coleofasciculus]|uniref:Uma2 family endonuclease n=1 Tax=unclassified Coleofasciculus TaxID=2692782 RepID=UPI00187E34B1|nr:MULTISPECIES: Uma2 family endonuclease [unclassified Coleofasciculus]MBE9128223.1 Uma2 family endonuclease [Coleofasciculus sp. LEGE 07081]MBE9147782.1 Uma2 family endonuclease [Coleofasciculus sp. LEGE 07092]